MSSTGMRSRFGQLPFLRRRKHTYSGNTILERFDRIEIWWEHKSDEPIGHLLELREDDHGLFVRAVLSTDTPRGQEVAAWLKTGVITDLSIGFDVIKINRIETARPGKASGRAGRTGRRRLGGQEAGARRPGGSGASGPEDTADCESGNERHGGVGPPERRHLERQRPSPSRTSDSIPKHGRASDSRRHPRWRR